MLNSQFATKRSLFPSSKKERKDILFAILLLAPTLYLLLRIFILPIVQSLVWSFFKYNLMDGSTIEYVGLRNYIDISVLQDFWISMKNTSYFTVFSVALELAIGFLCALVLNQTFIGRSFFRGIIIIPWAMLTLVNGLLWNWIYQPGYGALNTILHNMHVLGADTNPVWLSSSGKVVFFTALTDIWKMTPFMTLLLLAGMQSISVSLYEAAAIDGANFWKKIWHVTLPQLMPSLMIALVLRVIGAFRVYDILTVFTGNPNTSVSYLTYNFAFRYFYLGRASAMAWISTIFILIFIVIYMIMLKKQQKEQ
ncbi:carbohydrate ABC transporter permease [Paenibacillus alba]|uniref:Sugar ABC transporter permease n=1 Tax=Paenibacillus alba TaxID=1197127 RepID=A0ABU6G9G7_9BACL|nr:sugar ABC transporter permease [Paenibacillus alba]MEC0230792.1 sugar ABC transporter permease [Paenibacillus alba]